MNKALVAEWVISSTSWSSAHRLSTAAAACAAGGWSIWSLCLLRPVSGIIPRLFLFLVSLWRCDVDFSCLFNNSQLSGFCLCDAAGLKINDLCCEHERLKGDCWLIVMCCLQTSTGFWPLQVRARVWFISGSSIEKDRCGVWVELMEVMKC